MENKEKNSVSELMETTLVKATVNARRRLNLK